MVEGDNRNTIQLAAETASLEEQLQGWGEVMLIADKVLRWERAWFSPAIMASPQPAAHLSDSDFLTVASWIKPAWNHFEGEK
ncbi:hypothetical protein GH733_003884 [Mirounga leonina]|nr:hypothetical protein GH733_003884 [Mirounga leonina]